MFSEECNPSLVRPGWFKNTTGYWCYRRTNGDIYAEQSDKEGNCFVEYEGQKRHRLRGG